MSQAQAMQGQEQWERKERAQFRMAWVCPYCGKELPEEMARYAGCCGEVHCEFVEVDDAD